MLAGRGDPHLMFDCHTNVTGGKNSTFRFALPPIALRSGDKCALNETYPRKFAFAPLSKYEEQQECFKPFHLSYT